MLGLTTTVTTGKLPCGVFGEFYGKHYQSVYRAAKSVTRNFHDAQDIVQTVFARSLEEGPLSLDFLKNPEAEQSMFKEIFERVNAVAPVRHMETVYGALERLEELGYVRTRKEDQPRPKTYYQITESGNRAAAQARRRAAELPEDAEARGDPEGLEDLI
jgi:hypothetical protein